MKRILVGMGIGAILTCGIVGISSRRRRKPKEEKITEVIGVDDDSKIYINTGAGRKLYDKVYDVILDLGLSKCLAMSDSIYSSIKKKYPGATEIKVVYGAKNPLKTKLISLDSQEDFNLEFRKVLVSYWGRIKDIDIIQEEGD